MKKIISASLFSTCLLLISYVSTSQQVIELKQPLSNKIIIKLLFRNGFVTDPVGKEGLTEATADLITEGGTKTMTNRQIREFIFAMAASYNSGVDKEVSVFTFTVHKDFLQKFYPIIKGLILTPSFTEEDFSRVKSNQLNYVDEVIRASSDEDYSKLALEDLLFRGTRYQHMVAGKTPGVSAITLNDVKAHYKNFFTKNNLIIGIAGGYSPAFSAQLKKDLNQLPGTTPQIPTGIKANTPNGVVVEIISKPEALGSAIFTGAPLAITRASDDFAALMVANSYLGEHSKSYGKLYDKIRSVRSMNYGDYSYIEWYDNGGSNMLPQAGVPRSANYFSMWIRPVQIAEGLKKQYAELSDIETGHAQFALRLAVRELDNLINKGMSQKDFDVTRQFLRSYIKLYIQTPESQLGFLLDSKYYGRKDYIKEMDALLAKLTANDVNAAVKKYLQTQNMYVTIVTDDSEAGPLAQALKKNIPSPMSYSNLVREGLPKAVVAEDEEIAKYKLNVKSVKVINTKDTFK